MPVRADAYQILGLSDRNATSAEIKKAYKRAALLWHPDKNADDVDNAERMFKAVSEAHEVLSDTQKRAIYDTRGWEGLGFTQQPSPPRPRQPQQQRRRRPGPSPSPGAQARRQANDVCRILRRIAKAHKYELGGVVCAHQLGIPPLLYVPALVRCLQSIVSNHQLQRATSEAAASVAGSAQRLSDIARGTVSADRSEVLELSLHLSGAGALAAGCGAVVYTYGATVAAVCRQNAVPIMIALGGGSSFGHFGGSFGPFGFF